MYICFAVVFLVGASYSLVIHALAFLWRRYFSWNYICSQPSLFAPNVRLSYILSFFFSLFLSLSENDLVWFFALFYLFAVSAIWIFFYFWGLRRKNVQFLYLGTWIFISNQIDSSLSNSQDKIDERNAKLWKGFANVMKGIRIISNELSNRLKHPRKYTLHATTTHQAMSNHVTEQKQSN